MISMTGILATSKLYLTGMEDRNYFSAQALHFRTLSLVEDQSTIPTALPYINSEYTFDQAVLGGELSFDVSAYSLSRDDPDHPLQRSITALTRPAPSPMSIGKSK